MLINYKIDLNVIWRERRISKITNDTCKIGTLKSAKHSTALLNLLHATSHSNNNNNNNNHHQHHHHHHQHHQQQKVSASQEIFLFSGAILSSPLVVYWRNGLLLDFRYN